MNWIKDQWNKHGTKYMGSVTALLGAVQAAITLGLMEVSKGWKNAVALGVIFLGTGTVKRAIGSPPKTP